MRRLFIMMIMLFALHGCVDKGVLVVVNNNSGAPISSLKLEYTGGSIGTERVDNTQAYKSLVNPKSESHLEIQFTDNQGRLFKKKIDLYLEKNYKGTIEININKDNELTVKSDVIVN